MVRGSRDIEGCAVGLEGEDEVPWCMGTWDIIGSCVDGPCVPCVNGSCVVFMACVGGRFVGIRGGEESRELGPGPKDSC